MAPSNLSLSIEFSPWRMRVAVMTARAAGLGIRLLLAMASAAARFGASNPTVRRAATSQPSSESQ